MIKIRFVIYSIAILVGVLGFSLHCPALAGIAKWPSTVQTEGAAATQGGYLQYVASLGGDEYTNDFYSIVVSGTMVYAANGLRGLSIINVSHPQTPTVAGSITPPILVGNGLVDLATVGSRVYYPGGDQLSIINVSNPLSATYGYGNLIMRDPAAVAAAGHYAYLVSYKGLSGAWGMNIFDISDPLNAQWISQYVPPAQKPPFRVVASGNYAYLFGDNNAPSNVGLTIVDVTNPITPTQAGYYKAPNNVRDVATRDALAYVVDGGLRIVNITDPAAPLQVGAYAPLGAAFTRIAVQGNYAYILDSLDGLHILDVSAPGFVFQVGYYAVEQGQDVAVSGNYVYLVTRESLTILRFTPPSTVILPGGGSLSSAWDNTSYAFAAGAFTDTVVVTHTAGLTGSALTVGNLVGIDHLFATSAVYLGTGRAAQPAPGTTYTLTVHFTEGEKGVARLDSLALYYWDGNGWVKEPSSTVDPVNHIIKAQPNHISLWTVLGETQWVYLPFISWPDTSTYPRRLTSGSSNDTQPIFSPDGQKLVFISDRDGQTDIFSMPAHGGKIINLTQTLARQEDAPVFSPDGQTIAYATNATANGDWDIYLMNVDGTDKRAAIGNAGADETHPYFTQDGKSLIFASNAGGNWDIYSTTIEYAGSLWMWKQLTYDPSADRFPALSPDGKTIVFRSERDGNSNVYLMDASGANQRPFTTDPAWDGHGAYTPDMSGILFDSDRSGAWSSYLANVAGTGTITYEQRSGWQMLHSNMSQDGQWRIYAAAIPGGDYDLYIDRFTSPMQAIAQPRPDAPGQCGWEEGVLAYGWGQAWQATHQQQYLDHLREYVNRCMPAKATISHVNDSLVGYAALVVYQNDPQPQYLAFAYKIADWLMQTAQRTPDGTLSHMNDGDGVWCDTMVSVTPFLVEMSHVTSDTLYYKEAVTQTLKHANRLQDPATGLYHHAWSASQNNFIGLAYWSRGNGWVLLGDVAVLSAMPATHPSRATLLNIMRKQAAGLAPLQNSSGLWPNIVTRPEFYLETSGSALIGYGLLRGVQAGWLDGDLYAAPAQAAVSGVWRKTLADGSVTDVSEPTGPRADEAEYNALLHSQLQLYGQGAALLLEMP